MHEKSWECKCETCLLALEEEYAVQVATNKLLGKTEHWWSDILLSATRRQLNELQARRIFGNVRA